MGNPTAYITVPRVLPQDRPVSERVLDYKEVSQPASEDLIKNQASRCMDCGIPFCHHGCPLGNLIPDFNDAVYQGDFKSAYQILASTNNFPEFTGRICPAPCEAACVLGIHSEPVTIENVEKQIIEQAFANHWVNKNPPKASRSKSVAIIGSGPAGLAAADQLNQAGFKVTVYERNDKPGGLLRYGIPDFKLEKSIVDRRIDVMEQQGITFITKVNVGLDIEVAEINKHFDAVLLCGGSTVPRDLTIPGRETKGIYFAMQFLEQSNKHVDSGLKTSLSINAKDKNVIVIGGGDTGSDCIGTSVRQGAASVLQIELLGKPGINRTDKDPWPLWPMTLKTSSSHREGCERAWSIMTKRFIKNDNEELTGIEVADIIWSTDPNTGKNGFTEVEGSCRILPCDLVFLAAGFLHPEPNGVIKAFNVATDERGNAATTDYQTNISGVFSAGDMRRGQSLVVWAIQEGREVAKAVEKYLVN